MGQVNRLWYQRPAEKWIEALPIGNGRMGAMVYGGAEKERIQIDESTFWSGAASQHNNRQGTKELMKDIRTELLNNNYEKADILGHGFVGNKNQYGTNMPVGELKIKVLQKESTSDETENLERCLLLEEGIARTTFTMDGNAYSRECFISNPAQVFCLRMTSEHSFSLEFRFEGICSNTRFSEFIDDMIMIEGDALETRRAS